MDAPCTRKPCRPSFLWKAGPITILTRPLAGGKYLVRRFTIGARRWQRLGGSVSTAETTLRRCLASKLAQLEPSRQPVGSLRPTRAPWHDTPRRDHESSVRVAKVSTTAHRHAAECNQKFFGYDVSPNKVDTRSKRAPATSLARKSPPASAQSTMSAGEEVGAPPEPNRASWP